MATTKTTKKPGKPAAAKAAVGHTPGPWKRDGNTVTTRFAEAGICILEPLDDFWCGDVARLPTGDEMAANGRLIAAAPDLLASLEEMVTQFWADHDEAYRASFRRDYPHHPVVVAEAAIAKATVRA